MKVRINSVSETVLKMTCCTFATKCNNFNDNYVTSEVPKAVNIKITFSRVWCHVVRWMFSSIMLLLPMHQTVWHHNAYVLIYSVTLINVCSYSGFIHNRNTSYVCISQTRAHVCVCVNCRKFGILTAKQYKLQVYTQYCQHPRTPHNCHMIRSQWFCSKCVHRCFKTMIPHSELLCFLLLMYSKY
jgi:hypothetical protein